MRYYRLVTFGCKVNQCDSAGMAQDLAARGWQAAPAGVAPDLILVNTCTVTGRADQQARQAVRHLARECYGAPIWVTGCYAHRAPEEVAALPGVRAVLGNREKAWLAGLADHFLNHRLSQAELSLEADTPATGLSSPLKEESQGGGENLVPPPATTIPRERVEFADLRNSAAPMADSPRNPGPSLRESPSGSGLPALVGGYSLQEPFHPWPVTAFPGRTRAWVKVQEGCNHRCSYCVVPGVRGPSRSLEPAQVAGAFGELVGLGYREVVVTGMDLGQYGHDRTPPGSLAALLKELRETPWPFRLRLSSLEPQEVTPALLEECRAWARFCPHFHLPLQSGADAVLAAMGRPYRPQDFRNLVREINRLFPEAGLGLDILVGFPGETASDFAATRDLVASLPASYLHVFPFSPRPGTAAARLEPVAATEIQARAQTMRELGRVKKWEFLARQVGQVREVLVEGLAPRPGWLKGLSDNYLRVLLLGPAAWHNRLLQVRLLGVKGESLVGEAIDSPA